MTWKKVTLNHQEIAAGKLDRLQKEFFAAFMAAGMPVNAVMYAGERTRDGGHYYFTPGAIGVAPILLQSYGAVNCGEPDVRSFAVLVSNLARRDND